MSAAQAIGGGTPGDASRPLDLVVLGAAPAGLIRAFEHVRAAPRDEVRVVDTAPEPGGTWRTQRSEGFSCELGPQGFGLDAARERLLAGLGLAGQLVRAQVEVPLPLRRLAFAGAGPDAPLVTLRTGVEDLVQALRRHLGPRLLLGRPIRTRHASGDGYVVDLGGAVQTELHTRALHDARDADPQGPPSSVHLGFWTGDALPFLRGAGILLDAPPLRAALYVSNVFPGRAVPGRFLVRVVADVAPALAPESLAARAEAALRAATGLRGPLLFRRVTPTR